MDTDAWVQALENELHAKRAALRGRKPALRRVRGRTAVVTDAACSLPLDAATGELQLGTLAEHVRVVPIPVMIDAHPQPGQIYPESSAELARDLPIALAQGLPVRTSRPSPGRLAETYQQLHRDGFAAVVSIHLSAKLSGTVDAATLASAEAPLPVTVVDSGQAGLSLGHAVIAAAMTARLGGTQNEVVHTAETVAQSSRSFFAVPSLEQLRRGGRINRVASVLGSVMRVKPLLALREGEVVLLERTHSMPRALQRMSETATAYAETLSRPRIGVQCCGNPGEAADLAAELQPHSPQPVPVVEFPPGLAAHLGLGALGVSVTAGG
ncbi:DegV family protein [Nesterenkonia sphaerica]|uniref:DegV family protein n=1 Tax=Nesterenkonia sphaerica TaxID=1804988 RepID=A0A5R9AN31_9MICC|nr:DegV family protein [Nesterenkonia sphaerica]TLP79415.1 DegV family protein [Nesterenkonia sphaerica]